MQLSSRACKHMFIFLLRFRRGSQGRGESGGEEPSEGQCTRPTDTDLEEEPPVDIFGAVFGHADKNDGSYLAMCGRDRQADTSVHLGRH